MDMNTASVNRFRSHLREYVDQVALNHYPLKVTRKNADDFVVISAEDWEREQETLYILQDSALTEQIARSMTTHSQGEGYKPTAKELDEINRV